MLIPGDLMAGQLWIDMCLLLNQEDYCSEVTQFRIEIWTYFVKFLHYTVCYEILVTFEILYFMIGLHVSAWFSLSGLRLIMVFN